MKNDQISDKELSILLRELGKVLENNVSGDVVELGCYKGLTSLELMKLLKGGGRKLFLYDSFEGLPEKTSKDASVAGIQFKPGELPASKKQVIKLFKQAGLSVPRIKKVWFNELKVSDLPEKIAFAFLDGDFYESILDSLKLVWPKLSQGSVVVVDDYQNEALPGAQRAVDEWLTNHKAKLKVEASLAILQK